MRKIINWLYGFQTFNNMCYTELRNNIYDYLWMGHDALYPWHVEYVDLRSEFPKARTKEIQLTNLMTTIELKMDKLQILGS